MHTLWSCTLIQKYWKNILQILEDITKCHILPSLDLALLNLAIGSTPKPYRHVVTHILLAVRLSLTTLWKSDKTPSIIQTLELVNLHYSYEQMMASSRGQLARAQTDWQPWSQWSRAGKYIKHNIY